MRTVEIENSSRVVSRLRRQSRQLPIRLTDQGKLVAFILPAAVYDEEDLGYMTDPAFWKMIRQRRTSDAESIPLEEIKRELDEREQHAAEPRVRNGYRHKRQAGRKHVARGS